MVQAKEHQTTKMSEGKFKIRCPFTMVNSGGSTTRKRKVTLSIPQSATIDDIDVSKNYEGFYDVSDGGPGNNYVVLSVELPKKKTIEGAIIFYWNMDIPRKGMCPLNIDY